MQYIARSMQWQYIASSNLILIYQLDQKNNICIVIINISLQYIDCSNILICILGIDLVFGWKQIGEEAKKAVNVFHPMTYFGRDIDSEDDPVKRTALETMIKTYGQTPRQACFHNDDPKSFHKGDSLFS